VRPQTSASPSTAIFPGASPRTLARVAAPIYIALVARDGTCVVGTTTRDLDVRAVATSARRPWTCSSSGAAGLPATPTPFTYRSMFPTLPALQRRLTEAVHV